MTDQDNPDDRASRPVQALDRRRFLQLSGLAGIAAFVAACAPSGASSTPAASESAVTAGGSPRPQQPVTLHMLTQSDPVLLKGTQAVADAFKTSDGGKWSYVTLAFDTVPFAQLYDKIQTSVASGDTFDLLLADAPLVKNYAFHKVLQPLPDVWTADELKQWDTPSVDEGSYNGVFYAPPMQESAQAVFYNKDLTSKDGITAPTDLASSWTFDQALQAWQQAVQRPTPSANPSVWGLWPSQSAVLSDYLTGIFRRGYGSRDSNAFKGIADDGITVSGYFDAPEAIAGMQFFQDLFLRQKVTPAQYIPNIFTIGKAAFQISPDNEIGTIAAAFPNGGFNYGVTPIPKFANGTQLTQTGSWHWGVSPLSKHPNEVEAFVRFAAGPDGAKALWEIVRQIPANLQLLNSLPEYQTLPGKLFSDSLLQIGVPRIQTPGYQEFQTIVRTVNNDIVAGANVADRMHAAAQEMDGQLAKYKGWKTS